ncbi:hypothetical protein PHYBLDRAFT_152035 [Phycomyces blakesleeanus NRRL 1555(-)]|uniref:Uncharacterized protein n=1 Tax=Phycomyces blakesleeanus (strain ATCC 8743b / DSM 1359 / FGSC 10004 / NBRC 33097 / NRRL 1555) TaxID=763407 RepID=A0A162WFC0_PHYB8|nr:hypothetical protein PHYBLDRAFT_152035 [Phycomyces blakesleeanus NRRL 1555(-)]OAD66765.1 hypothetical protein PHYBLDRAFT_152035 [Phycomyces blakesleeanus NRRL 1555(-)]|eukprot:XP_018284805.1 hypothetical protein PHYBLDRAFT_152035 [Phycomyces blakesleeanus NRRL 1555(-)]
MTNSLVILHCVMTTVIKDIADIKAKTLDTSVSAVLQSQPMALVHTVPLVSMEINVAGSPIIAFDARSSPNTELTENLIAYLERNFIGEGLRESDVRNFVYMNFTSRKRAAKKSQTKKKSENACNRRSSREKESNKTDIDDKMKRDRSGLIIEEAMSVGESDDGTLPHYNHFITLVDKKVVADLGSNSHQLLSHAFGKTIEGPVSDAIVSQFPQ